MSEAKKRKRSHMVDDLVGFFSPEAAFRRMQFRRAAEQLRKYEASASGRRFSGWTSPGSSSANAEVGPALSRVRERVRDLVRNNPHAGRAVGLIEGYVVGTGIMAGISMPTPAQQATLRSVWNDWADSTDCDVDGLHNFYGLQALAMRTAAESGEALIVRRWRKMSDGYRIPVPFQIQVLEGDFIDTLKEGTLDNGGFIIQGVEFNKRAQRVAYWLFNQHPGERSLMKRDFNSRRVPASDIQHLFRADRSGQVRGISWGTPCVVRHHDLDAYEDAQLLRQRIAACFAGFVKDMAGETPADKTEAEEDFPEKIESGAIEILPPGKEIIFPNLPIVSNDGHQERVLRSIAIGWGVSYEGLSGDWSGVNYSSGRLGMLDLKRNVLKWQWHMFVPRFCVPVFGWFLEAANLMGFPTDGAVTTWTAPKFEMIDPTKEIPATITAIRGGIQTLPEAIREQGRDFEEHVQEMAKSNKALDDLGLIIDSDPRKVMKAGMMQFPVSEELSPSNGSDGKGK